MRIQFGAHRTQYIFSEIATITKISNLSDITTNGSIYLAISARNAVGFNYPTSLQLVNYVAGDKIVVTIAEEAVRSGESINEIVISGSLDNNVENLVRLAGYSKPFVFPLIIEITKDDHLTLNNAVSLATLPIDPLEGSGIAVTDLSKFFIFRSNSIETANNIDVLTGVNGGRWLEIGSLGTYVDNIYDIGGSYCPVNLLSPDDFIDPLVEYSFDGTLSSPTRFWLCPENNEAYAVGSRFGLSVYVDSELKSWAFSGRLQVVFRGIVDIESGELDVLLEDNITPMRWPNVTVDYVFNKLPNLVLERELIEGEAFCFDVYLKTKIKSGGNLIGFRPTIYEQAGEYVAIGSAIGNAIFNEGNYRRFLPDLGLSGYLDTGSGIVSNLAFPLLSKANIALVQNEANQRIAIDGNGNVFLYLDEEPILSTQAQRAIISTALGISKLTAPVSISLSIINQEININLLLPQLSGISFIRENYPDVVRGNAIKFNVPFIVVYVTLPDSSIKQKYYAAGLEDSQILVIDELNTWDDIEAIPDNADLWFNLFELPEVTLSNIVNENSELDTGTYTIQVGYLFDGHQVTKIDHRVSSGNIVEFPVTLAEAINNFYYWGSPKSLTELRADKFYVNGRETKLLLSDGTTKDMIFVATDTNADDGLFSIKPDLIPVDKPGRYRLKGVNFTFNDIIPLVLALG